MYTYYGVTMATIQKFTRSKGIVYRVLIRKAGTKPISKTFTSKKLSNLLKVLMSIALIKNYNFRYN